MLLEICAALTLVLFIHRVAYIVYTTNTLKLYYFDKLILLYLCSHSYEDMVKKIFKRKKMSRNAFKFTTMCFIFIR